jgi:hypothetical protein
MNIVNVPNAIQSVPFYHSVFFTELKIHFTAEFAKNPDTSGQATETDAKKRDRNGFWFSPRPLFEPEPQSRRPRSQRLKNSIGKCERLKSALGDFHRFEHRLRLVHRFFVFGFGD